MKAESKSRALRCVQDIRDFPPLAYRLPDDGRKWKRLCYERQRVAVWFATFANPDGSRVEAGIPRAVESLGIARSTVFNRLDDLKKLNVLASEGRAGMRGTAIRRFDLGALELNLQKWNLQESKIDGKSPGLGSGKSPGLGFKSPGLANQESGIGLQESRIDEQESSLGVDPTVQTVQTTTTTVLTENLKSGGGGGEEKEAAIVDENAALQEFTKYFTTNFEEAVLIENLLPVRDLLKVHGKETVLEAWKLYLRDWQYPFTGENRTKLPLKMFVQSFDQWHTKLQQGHRVVEKREITAEQIARTNELAKQSWLAAHPEYRITENGLELIQEEEEPGPEALFEGT